MATTVNGIGTRNELLGKGVGWFNGASGPSPGVTSAQCPTQSIIQNNLHGKIINNTYANAQTPRYSDVIMNRIPVEVSGDSYVSVSAAVYLYFSSTGFGLDTPSPTGDFDTIGGISGTGYNFHTSLVRTHNDRARIYGIVVQNLHATGSGIFFDMNYYIHARNVGLSGSPGNINNTIHGSVYNVQYPHLSTSGAGSMWYYVIDQSQPLPANIQITFSVYSGGGGTGSGGTGSTGPT
jgi:hypothetical protein